MIHCVHKGSPSGSRAVRLLAGAILLGTGIGAAAPRVGAATGAHEPAAAVRAAKAQVTGDIRTAKADLAAASEEVAAARTALVGRLAALRQNVRELQERVALLEARDKTAREQLAATEKTAAHLASVTEFVDTLSAEYRRAFATRISAAQSQRHADAFEHIDAKLGAGDRSVRLDALPALLELARRHGESVRGAHAFPGRALDLDGNVVSGAFIEAGPAAFFAGAADGPAGLVIQRVGSTMPTIFSDLGSAERVDRIRQLAATGQGLVPIDPTQGGAIMLRRARESWTEHLRKGGVIMVPLLGLAAVCAVLALYKLLSLTTVAGRGAETQIAAILAALEAGRVEDALVMAGALRKPLGRVIRDGIEHREASKEHIEEIMYERVLAQVPGLEKLLTPLAVCASVAPLLGLLGTVTGMIHTFRLITVFGTGDAKVLSSGISEALITTEFGLMIAIPALLLHVYLSRRVRKVIAITQQSAIMFVNGLKLRRSAAGNDG